MAAKTKPLSRLPDARRTAEPPPLDAETEALALQFSATVRRDVRRFLRTSPRFADLARVFPAAIFALASRRGPRMVRARAAQMVMDGAPLRRVAQVLDLPLWLRRMPPEAFQAPLGALPQSENFSRRIANLSRTSIGDSALWLSAMEFATLAVNEDFALWLAVQPIYGEPGTPLRLLPVLSAYAWFSAARTTRAHQLIVVPWRQEIAFDTALCAAQSWLNRLRLVLQLPRGALTDAWLVPGEFAGLNFVPLLDREEILNEARAMQNCADQYATRLVNDKCRLFSIRRDGEHVATLEVGPHPREVGMLAITQLKARHNMPAPISIWQAAYSWLGTQAALRRAPQRTVPARPLAAESWRVLIQPYRDATGGAAWLAEQPTHDAFDAFDAQMADLARRGGVSSWLFT